MSPGKQGSQGKQLGVLQHNMIFLNFYFGK